MPVCLQIILDVDSNHTLKIVSAIQFSIDDVLLTYISIIFYCLLSRREQEMASRLQILQQSIKGELTNVVDSSFDYLHLASFLTQPENDQRLRLRKFCQEEIVSAIDPYVEEAKFPQFLLPKLKQFDLFSNFFKKPHGKEQRITLIGSLIAELARVDAGVATFAVVQYGLLGYTIQLLGSEEQKKKYLPSIMNLDLIGGWGLTQEKIGSDASNIQTSATKVGNTYKLNGTKRWIGNGNRDLLIVWAKNTENKKVEGFIVENKNVTGLTSQAIKNKLALRVVQNCHITLNNVTVGQDQKLPLAVDFNTGTNAVLKHSRVIVCWIAAGVAMGVYDNAIRYISQRKQFGKRLSNFQMVQEKIVKVMSNTQAILLLCFRISHLYEEKKVSFGQISMAKAFITDRLREITRWGREIYGGNGIVHDNYAMKALADAEALHTYEGTYEINTLVAGREITGVSAFK